MFRLSQRMTRNVVVSSRKFATGPPPGEAALTFCAKDALERSCYLKIDFKIPENVPVYDAVKRMAAHHVGALAVTAAGDNDKIIGIISERDYLSKVALMGKQSRTTMVSEIFTQGASNLITVNADTSVDECMRKILASDVRHLLIKDSTGKIVSLFSIKDLCKCVVAKHNEVVERLTNFGVGKGAFFGSE